MTNEPARSSRVSRLCLIALAGLIMGLVVALSACGITGEGRGRRVATPTPPKVSKESVTVPTRALPSPATQAPTRPTKKAVVTMKGAMPKPTPGPDGELILTEGEAQAIYESFYSQESDKPKKSIKPRLFVAPTIKDPKDLRDLAIGEGPSPIIPDLPDPEPGTEKPSWINGEDGDSKRFPTLFPRQPKGTSGESPPSDDVTIRGRLFYNDLRLTGRFDERRDPNGNPGVGISSLRSDIGKWCYNATYSVRREECGLLDEENLLAARMVVADFWEVDREYKWGDRRDCEDFQYLGGSTVGIYGNYSLVLPNLIDDCPDGNPAAEIAVQFRLKFCNSDTYCFELDRKNDEGQELYEKYHRDAKPWDPLIVNLGSTHELVDEKFGGDLADDIGKEWAIAANHYATLVDTMHVVHDEAEIPFRFDEYGGLVVFMCPEAYKATLSEEKKEKKCFNGRTFGTGEIGISEPYWPKGPVLAHEYGHVLDNRTGSETNCRAWGLTDCHYGRQPDDEIEGYKVESWSATSYEYPYAALKEGWANFISRAVFSTCDAIEENTGKGEVQPDYRPTDHHGNGYVINVTKLLCDWHDEHRAQDDDAEMFVDGVDRFPGYGDRFEASLWSIWYNLDKSTPGVQGKAICDYASYYIEERKGSARVGQSDHDYYKERIVNLLYNNGLKCGYEAPEPKTADDRRGPAKNGTVCQASPSGRKECD